MRATNYATAKIDRRLAVRTRRNPDDAVDLAVTLATVGGCAIVAYAVYKQIEGAAAVGKGIGGALGATGQAAGQTASAIGTGAHDAAGGIGGAIGSFFSGLGGDINARLPQGPSPSAGMAQLATQWRRAAAANPGGSNPDDWNAFRAFCQQINAGDPGPTPFAGWPQGYGGSVSFGTGNPYG